MLRKLTLSLSFFFFFSYTERCTEGVGEKVDECRASELLKDLPVGAKMEQRE